MDDRHPLRVSRRAVLAAAATAAVAAGREPAAVASTPPAMTPGPDRAATRRAIAALHAALTPAQRREVCLPWDVRVDIRYGRTPLWRPDPAGVLLRTHLANAWLITPHRLASDFYTAEQRGLVDDVLATTFTPEWLGKLRQQALDDSGLPWGGDQALAIFGDPTDGPCMAVVTGFHLTARATCDDAPLAAFGGGIAHGHQPSGFYEKFHHPGNLFWPQSLAANDIFALFDDAQRRRALLAEPVPFFQYHDARGTGIDRETIRHDTSRDGPRRESDIRFRLPGDPLPGLPVKDFSAEQRRALDELLARLLEPYRPRLAHEVHDCLRAQGGLDTLALAFYRDRDMGQDGIWDNWRLEGPAFVWFFRGAPHVHSWIHVARDPSAPLSSYFG